MNNLEEYKDNKIGKIQNNNFYRLLISIWKLWLDEHKL